MIFILQIFDPIHSFHFYWTELLRQMWKFLDWSIFSAFLSYFLSLYPLSYALWEFLRPIFQVTDLICLCPSQLIIQSIYWHLNLTSYLFFKNSYFHIYLLLFHNYFLFHECGIFYYHSEVIIILYSFSEEYFSDEIPFICWVYLLHFMVFDLLKCLMILLWYASVCSWYFFLDCIIPLFMLPI